MRSRRALAAFAGVLVLASGLAALWRFTSLGQQIDPEVLRDRLIGLRDSPWSVPLVWGGFVTAGFLVVPLNALFLAVGLAFDLGSAIALSLSGGLLSAWALHEAGHRLDMDRLLDWAPRLRSLKERHLENAGIAQLSLLRLVPVAPFTIMCLLWAAAGVPRRRMLAATVRGLLPGALATALIGQGAGVLWQGNSGSAVLLVAGSVLSWP